MKNLNGKIVALTGAASGIGRCLAIELANQGCILALTDIDEAGLQETVRLLPSTTKASAHVVDVANKDFVHIWADEIVATHSAVDVVINNAGVTSTTRIEDITYEDFNWVFNIVFYGVLYGSKAFLPYLKQRSQANIVNISSVNGFFPFPNNGPYNAAKHAVKGLNQTLMQELASTSVKVCSVHPGGIRTNIVRNSRSTDPTVDMNKEAIAFEKVAGTSAEKAAKIIVRGLKKDKKRILVGKDAVAIDILVRIFPQGFADLVGFVFRQAEKRKQRSKNST